ncbi:hypothetical protein [Thiomicrospira sp. XS5]|uniref:hypothetical protein n=1 Tax=Thiomicrospira sp. XS5 TaxID=1775636 RepID=UPI000837D538|nr:hypothetical protein [Thiomicrospira sp. XS5]
MAEPFLFAASVYDCIPAILEWCLTAFFPQLSYRDEPLFGRFIFDQAWSFFGWGFTLLRMSFISPSNPSIKKIALFFRILRKINGF